MGRLAAAVAVLVLTVGAADARAAAVVPVEGSWAGVTSAGLPVHFGVVSGRVVNTRFRFRWGFCGTYESHERRADLAVDAAGHWAFDDPRGQTLEGTFVAPDRVEGKVISVERQLPGCPRTEATFSAAPVPPNPESPAVARAGIEALPYEIHLRDLGNFENVLIGRAFGALGETFRFFLFVNRSAPASLPGVRGYELSGPHNRVHPGLEGGHLANTDVIFATVPKRSDTRAQTAERREILAAVKDTVCLRQTGAPCPSP